MAHPSQKRISPELASRLRILGECLAQFWQSLGLSRRGLARLLNELGVPLSDRGIANIEANRHIAVQSRDADGSYSYKHARKPWDNTLRALAQLEGAPQEMLNAIEDLLQFERVLAMKMLAQRAANENRQVGNFLRNSLGMKQ